MTTDPTPRPVPVPAAGVVVWRGDEALLIRRGKPPRQGEWSLPGGRIEPGERAAEAAIREALEETGCLVAVTGLVDVVDFIAEGRHFVLFDYAARWVSGDPCAGDDATEARFFPFDALPQLGLWSETMRVIAASRTFESFL